MSAKPGTRPRPIPPPSACPCLRPRRCWARSGSSARTGATSPTATRTSSKWSPAGWPPTSNAKRSCASVATAKLDRQVASAQRLQRSRLPVIAPLLDGWQLAGRSRQADTLGGAFHDWFSLPKGLLGVAIGRAAEQGIVGAINADAVMSALRSHAQHRSQPERILHDANLTLWTGSAGDRHVTALAGLIDPATGRFRCSAAGRPSGIRLRADGWESLGREHVGCVKRTTNPPTPPPTDASESLGRETAMLGESPETRFSQLTCELRPGEALIFWTDGSGDELTGEKRTRLETELAENLLPQLGRPADELLAAATTVLDGFGPDPKPRDRAILIVKRTPA